MDLLRPPPDKLRSFTRWGMRGLEDFLTLKDGLCSLIVPPQQQRLRQKLK
jgi:hypothetical protein